MTLVQDPTTTDVPSEERRGRLLAAARALGPELSARAEEAERLGTLPADLVATIRAAGLFRIVQAKAFGGAELPPAAMVELIEELSRADGSAGWTIMIGNGAPAYASWLDPAVGRDLLGADADFTSASVFAPLGRGEAAGEGRLAVSGRWSWSSGARHAEWFTTGLFVFDGDTPRMIPGRGPDWRLAWFRASEAEVIDNWDVAGMRGTGSHDVAADGLTVAEEHTISPFFEPARHDGALWRLPFFTLIGTALVGAGAARSSHPLQRCLRDIHVVAQHVYFGAPATRAFAKTRFGIDEPTFTI